MGAALLAHVAGTITGAFASEAERDGAYDFLSNTAVKLVALTMGIWSACAKRCEEFEWVYVPIDGSSLALTDAHKTRGTGAVGTHKSHGLGFIVMTAIAVSPTGVPLGVCGQKFWTRASKRIKDKGHKRTFEEKESRYWIVVAEQVMAAFRTSAKRCVPWFQFDRGGDIGEVLLHAVADHWRITVRASWNRRLNDPEEVRYLWGTLLKQPEMGRYALDVPEGKHRESRVAQMSVRACSVTLRLKDKRTKKIRTVTIGAVHTREVGTTPAGEKPIEWMLLTTAPIANFADARQVIDGYAQRWKIELFHRLWKSGRCNVEDNHLHTSERILKWATILASVAMRTLQLTYQARNAPEMPADQLLSRDEIDAIILLRKPNGYAVGDTPGLGITVRWIAQIGGFTNKGKKVHPGKIVVGRGLDRIAAAVELLRTLRPAKKKAKK